MHRNEASAQNKLLNRLRGAKNLFGRLQELKRQLSAQESLELVTALSENAYFRSRLLPQPFAASLTELGRQPFLASLSVAQDLAWAVAWCLANRVRLRAFVEQRELYNLELLRGELQRAAQVLDAIEGDFGPSLWLIKHRLFLLSQSGTVEAQRHYCEQVKAQAGKGILPFLAAYWSVRNEPAHTIARFTNEFAFILNRLSAREDLKKYLQFHCLPHVLRVQDASAIIRYEYSNPVIDVFVALGVLLPAIAVSESAEKSLAASLALRLTRALPDPALISLVGNTGTAALDPTPDTEARRCLDDLLRPDAEGFPVVDWAGGKATVDLLLVASRLTATAETGAQVAALGATGLAGQLAELLRSAEGVQDTVASLVKYAVNTFPSQTSLQLLGSVSKEMPTASPKISVLYQQIAAITSPTSCPLLAANAPAEYRESFADRAVALYDTPSEVIYLERILTEDAGPASISRSELLLADATLALDRGDARRVIVLSDELANCSGAYYRRWASRFRTEALLALAQPLAAAAVLARACVNNPHWNTGFPIKRCVEALREVPSSERASEIAVPIVFGLHRQHIARSADQEVVHAYQDFLESYSIVRPSELAPLLNGLDRALVVHFLRYICVESVMDRAGEFPSSRAVAEERLAVCRLLTELDPGNPEPYHNEIKEITRRLKIRSRIKEIDQSRVYVDRESLRKVAVSELRETFNRFVALGRHRMTALPAESSEERQVKSGGAQEERPELPVPSGDPSDLFRSLVLQLRTEYLSSSEHGLDKYLSVRIRHGTLTAHLRRPVEAAQLITPREPGGGYQRNAFWPKKIYPSSEPQSEWLATRLGAFSEGFDGWIDRLLDRLRISTTGEGDGLFRFVLTSEMVSMLERRVLDKDLTFEQCLDEVILLFDTALDISLEDVREYFASEAKAESTRLLDALEEDVERVEWNNETGPLRNAIRSARTELLVALDRVAEWFRRATDEASEPFGLQDAVDISVESVRVLQPHFRASLEEPGLKVIFKGARLTAIVDMLFIMFENIVRHAQLDDDPRAEVRCEIDEESRLWIVVENDLGPRVSPSRLKERLATVRQAIADGSHGASVSREGGTGLHKLGKILAHEFRDTRLDFAMTDSGRFSVCLSAKVNYETVAR